MLMAMVDQTPRVLRIGIGDHIRCAVLGRAEQRPLDGRFPKLPVLLAGAAPAGYRIVSAHRCDFDGRSPTRLVFQNGALILSLIVAPRLKLESLHAERYRTAEGRFPLAGSETGERFVFAVSDITPEENRASAESMMPVVPDFLHAGAQKVGRRLPVEPQPRDDTRKADVRMEGVEFGVRLHPDDAGQPPVERLVQETERGVFVAESGVENGKFIGPHGPGPNFILHIFQRGSGFGNLTGRGIAFRYLRQQTASAASFDFERSLRFSVGESRLKQQRLL